MSDYKRNALKLRFVVDALSKTGIDWGEAEGNALADLVVVGKDGPIWSDVRAAELLVPGVTGRPRTDAEKIQRADENARALAAKIDARRAAPAPETPAKVQLVRARPGASDRERAEAALANERALRERMSGGGR